MIFTLTLGMFYSLLLTHDQTKNPLFIYILWTIPSSESTGWSHRKDHQGNVWFLGRIWLFVLFCSASSIHPHQIPITTPVTTWTIRLLFPVRNRLVMNFLSLLKIKSLKYFCIRCKKLGFIRTFIILNGPQRKQQAFLALVLLIDANMHFYLQSLLPGDHLWVLNLWNITGVWNTLYLIFCSIHKS